LIAGSFFCNITKPVTPNVNLGLKEVLENHDMSSKILRIKSCEALDVVRATVEGMVSRSSCRKTMPMDESLLKVVKKYGENFLLKVSDRKPKPTAPKRKEGIEKRRSSKV